MSYEQMVHDLHQFILSKGIRSFTMVGICFGGRVAIQYATMYPNFVDGVILIEASIGIFEY
jgi:pimeloyl-ACP methyl ester carboxylesterase